MANSNIMALDVGNRRIGVSLAGAEARLASPLVTIENSENVIEAIVRLADQNNVGALVVGLPRGLDGQTTDQTKAVEEFILKLRQAVTIDVHEQDEAVTSKQAEAELERRGKPYSKSDIDALAATYILEDYLKSHVI